MRELDDYRALEQVTANRLESSYINYIMSGDIKKAYDVVGRLMAYKLIQPTDDRISNNNKLFENGGVQPDHRFKLDYRRSEDYIPEWLYKKLPYVASTNVTVYGHYIEEQRAYKRIEYKIKERDIAVKIRQVISPRDAIITAENIIKLVEEHGTKVNAAKTKVLAKYGIMRLFEISAMTLQSVNKVLGYIYIGKTKSGAIKANIVLNWAKLNAEYIEIQSTIRNLKRTIYGNFGREIAVSVYSDYKKYLDIETDRKKRVHEKDIKLEQLRKEEEKKAANKEKKKEARV